MSNRWEDMERERQFAEQEKPENVSFDPSEYLKQYKPMGSYTFDQGPSATEKTMDTAGKLSGYTAPFMATGPGAAVAVGASFAAQYMAQKAAEERERRQRAAEIAQQHGQQEQNAYGNLINVYKSALRA